MAGRGEKILFLHGWPTHGGLWQAQVESLKFTYQTICLDWLGFGQSDKPADQVYSFTRQKEALDATLSQILTPDESITFVAHDIGGPPAILWASENPTRVRRLILLNTVLYPFKTPLDALSEIMMHTPGIKDLFVSQWGLRQVLKTNTKSRNQTLAANIQALISPWKSVSPSLIRRTLTQPLSIGRKQELLTLSELFRQLSVPRHLIIARRDPLCYAHIRKLSQENPTVPVYPLPDCGHFIPIDQPQALNGILKTILREEADQAINT